MLLFNEATKKDFRKLLELISEYELDKQATFEKLNKVDQQKLFKENKKNLKTFLVDKTYKYLLCWDNEKLVGYMFLSYDDNIYAGEGFVNEVYVMPAYRRNGIAKKLLQKGISWLKNNNCTTIDVTVHKKNKPAIALYKHVGFAKTTDTYIAMTKVL